MKGAVAIRRPVQTVQLSFASTNVTTGAWVQLIASLAQACSAIEVFNGSPAMIKIAQGSAGNEVAVPYTILPGGSPSVLPIELSSLARISLETVDQTANTGYIVINFFQ
jgi:hypothetical protein